jgi:hypothetical protein
MQLRTSLVRDRGIRASSILVKLLCFDGRLRVLSDSWANHSLISQNPCHFYHTLVPVTLCWAGPRTSLEVTQKSTTVVGFVFAGVAGTRGLSVDPGS